jgi:uncharacterized Zn finger protein
MYKCPVCGGNGAIIKDNDGVFLLFVYGEEERALATCTKCGVLYMVKPIYKTEEQKSQ